MLYFEFGQNRMAEGGAFAEHVRAGAQVADFVALKFLLR